eukprot:scaffold100148_cov20-Tisochrysis_lutea.AAC.1
MFVIIPTQIRPDHSSFQVLTLLLSTTVYYFYSHVCSMKWDGLLYSLLMVPLHRYESLPYRQGSCGFAVHALPSKPPLPCMLSDRRLP